MGSGDGKMRLRQLFESQHHAAGIIFGRFNPPHFGHKAAWEDASAYPIWYIGTNQSTQGPKDPLPFDIKIEAMKALMPEIQGHLVSEQSWWTLATMVYKKHGEVTLYVVTDEQDATVFYEGLKKFNGVEGPHGYYKFKDVLWHKARRLSKATDLRKAVEHDDPQAFTDAAGVDASTIIAGKPYFELVKHYMAPYLHAAAEKEKLKAEKEKLKAEKLATKVKKEKVVKIPADHVDENLIKYANKVLREMRSREFVSEGHPNAGTGHTTELATDHDNVMKGASRSRDVGGYDRVYHLNRLMMAMAMHDGKGTHPVDSAKDTWFEKYNTMHPMTQEEDNMIRGAMKTVPTDGKHVSKFSHSKEAEGGNKTSPVAQPKKNKYGI
jgi:hypothetical protein